MHITVDQLTRCQIKFILDMIMLGFSAPAGAPIVRMCYYISAVADTFSDFHSVHCTMGKLQWEFGNRNSSFLREKCIWNIWTMDMDKMGGKVENSI